MVAQVGWVVRSLSPWKGPLLALVLTGCAAESEYETPQLPPPPPPPPAAAPAPMPEPYGPDGTASSQAPAPPATAAPQAPASPPPAAAPAPAQAADQTTWVQSYPSGQWVYTVDHGWIWVPAGADTVVEDGVPYAYFYTPLYGWTWYVSPWGWGPYHYGLWFRHPWHPYGWHGRWVAHPAVVGHLNVHVGGHYGGFHGGGGHGHHR